MPTFRTARNRDAWASIRGFLFQACLTVQRWLTLAEDESLELERGEDIDTVSRAFAADEEESGRLLEQVKFRETNVSLRAEPVVAFLANALEHSAHNPTIGLTFRFLTNATPALERPTTLGQLRGIEAWGQLRSVRTSSRGTDDRLEGVRALLRTVSRPGELPDGTWERFHRLVNGSSAEEFATLVGRVEFSCGIGDYAVVRQEIVSHLLERRLVSPGGEMVGYWALLVSVLQVLSTPGPKSLRAGDVGPTLASAGTDVGARRITELISRVTSWEAATEELAIRVARHEEAIQELGARVTGLNKESASPLLTVSRRLLSEPPLLPSNVVRRSETVGQLAVRAKAGSWLAINGRPGLGKSIAALLLCADRGATPRWMRLRGLTPNQCAEAIASDLAADSLGEAPQIVVADDLPRLTPGDPLFETLARTSAAVCSAGHVLVSTSNFRLPAEIADHLKGVVVDEQELPPFTDDEAREFLRLAGAPPNIVGSKIVAAINAIVSGHPTLLRAAASFLRGRGWQFDATTLEALFTRAFTREVDERTQRLLTATVSDNARELIYRLDLVIGTASDDTIRCVALAPPPVERVFEALSEVVDLWIQRNSDGYALSPLVRRLGENNLRPEVKRSVAGHLAKNVLARKTINQRDAMAAITYFIAAERVDDAGWVLISILGSFEKAPNDVDDFGLLSAWSSAELPAEMHHGLQLMVRGTQARVLQRRGRDPQFVLLSLERLVRATPKELRLAALGAAVSAAIHSRPESVAMSLRILAEVLPDADDVQKDGGKGLEWPAEARPEDLVWMLAPSVDSPAALDSWIACWNGLTSDQRRRLAEAEYYPVAAMTLSSKIWQREGNRPENERRWPEVHAAISRLEEAARTSGASLLAACAVRSRIIVSAEYQDDIAGAERAATSALAIYSANAEPAFLIREAIGRQFVIRSKWAQAHAWFADAFRRPTPGFPIIRYFALMAASLAAANVDEAAAIPLLVDAAHIAATTPVIPEVDRVAALAELAIAEWRAKDLQASFARWDEAATVLLGSSDRSSEWRDVAVLVGHCLGYLSLLAEAGAPPSTTADGSQYAAPRLGMFHSVPKGIGARHAGSFDAVLAAQMVLFADGVGASDRAEAWTLLGLERAEGPAGTLARGVLYQRALPYLLSTNAFTPAILQARSFTASHPKGPELDERLERELVCVPVAARVATLAVENASLGQLAAQECAAAFGQIAAGSHLPEPWRDAATLLMDALVARSGARALFAAPQQKPAVKAEWSLHMMANLLATLQHDCPIKTAVAVHANAMHHMVQLSKDGAMAHRVLWPFVSAFWNRVMTERRFLLNTPSYVESQLVGIPEMKPVEALRMVLRTIVDDQRSKISADDRRWLVTGTF